MHKVIVCLSGILISNLTWGEDQVIVLSGGDNPGLNHYSQYLQTKTIYDYLADKYGTKNTAIYFGIGNTPDTLNPFPDVHQIKTESGGAKVDYMLPGIIENNKAATKENVLGYFFSPPVKSLTTQDNLFLMVSDHGLPDFFIDAKSDPYSNNCIDLWNFNESLGNNFINNNNLNNICLSQSTLKTTLEKIAAKHIVFQMSQCFSGGFHQMSVGWQNGYPSANPKICGFTAATADHYASGCTGDANGPSYQGYERSFTEWYTGKSVPTGKVLRTPAANIWEAHNNAILEDMTVDTPITTSDYYLLQWAKAFSSPDFKPRVTNYSAREIKNIFNNYNDYLPNYKIQALDSFKLLSSVYEQKINAKYPADKGFFKLGFDQQEQNIAQREKVISGLEQNYTAQQEWAMNTYRYIVLPKWVAAVKNHSAPLSSHEYEMENELYLKIMHPEANLTDSKTYWTSLNPFFLQYLALNNNDPEVLNYNKNRNIIIANWAKANNNPAIANAMQSLIRFSKDIELLQDKITAREQEKQLLKRAYLYRQVMAAWVALSKIQDKQALNELNGLIECQQAK